MDIIIGFIIFIIGTTAGFFVNKRFSASEQAQKKIAEQANQTEAKLAQYKLDVAEHLESSASLLAQMNNTCQVAIKQMEKSTALLQQATPTEIESIPFFSKETEEQLAETAKLRHQKKNTVKEERSTEAPLDYSGNPSGLFDDRKQTVTNPD
jgi:uncharacterized membrane-anchored protein YhcB (DUF1043 family)